MLYLSASNLFLEDSKGESHPVSRYFSLALPGGQELVEGRDPVIDEQKLTVHFDYLPDAFEPARLVVETPSGGRLEVNVAGVLKERSTVPSIPVQ